MIKKEGNEYCLYTKDGKRKLGCHPTKAGAEEQERAIYATQASGIVPNSLLSKYCNKCTEDVKVSELQKEQPDVMEAIINAARNKDPIAAFLAKEAGFGKPVMVECVTDTAKLRTEFFEGRQYVVVPVIALVEGVIKKCRTFPVASFVPAEEILISVNGWNGEPVMMDHPQLNDGKLTANTPERLEKQAFGKVFNAEVVDKKLVLEAWLDPQKARRVGRDAEKVLERLNNNEIVSVSVGMSSLVHTMNGEYNGEPYNCVWTNLTPDHLAFLPEGTDGACSVEMGCGAAKSLSLSSKSEKKGGNNVTPWLRRVFSHLKKSELINAEGLSDNDLRRSLETELSKLPGYYGIQDVYPDTGIVVYDVTTGDSIVYHERSFKLFDDKVELSEDYKEVEPKTEWVQVNASSVVEDDKKGENMIDEKRIEALLASGKTQFTKEDISALKQLSDASFAKLEAQTQEKEPEIKLNSENTPNTPQTEEEFLAIAPDSIKQIVEEHKFNVAAERTKLLAAMKEIKQDIYTDDEVEKMELKELRKVVQLASLGKPTVDNSGRAVSRVEPTSSKFLASPPKMSEVFLQNAQKGGS